MNSRTIIVGSALAVMARTGIAAVQAPPTTSADASFPPPRMPRASTGQAHSCVSASCRLLRRRAPRRGPAPHRPAARKERVVRRAREGRGQLLFSRHQDPQRLGSRRQRRHHHLRGALRLRRAGRDRRRDAEAWPRHQQGQVHRPVARPRRPRRRRAISSRTRCRLRISSTAGRIGTRSTSRRTTPAASRSATSSAPTA